MSELIPAVMPRGNLLLPEKGFWTLTLHRVDRLLILCYIRSILALFLGSYFTYCVLRMSASQLKRTSSARLLSDTRLVGLDRHPCCLLDGRLAALLGLTGTWKLQPSKHVNKG